MRLPTTRLAAVIALSGLLSAPALLPAPVQAESATRPTTLQALSAPAEDPPARLFIIGAGEDADARLAGLPQVIMEDMPAAAKAREAVVAAILRAAPVASFAARDPVAEDGAGTHAAALFLRLEVEAGPDTAESEDGGNTDAAESDGISLVIGDEAMDLPEFGRRLAALTEAVAPEARPLLYLRIVDPGDRLASHVSALREAAAGASFAFIVATTGEGETCRPAIAPDLALAAGLADRVPFGDGDGVTSMTEASAWLEAALARPARRRPDCAGAHVLILHDDAQAALPVIGAPAASLSPGVEEQLAREILAAHVLSSATDPAAIDAWLADCIFCPGEAALDARAGALREEARTRAVEASLWSEIAGDTTPERIRAWLATCRFCAQRDEAEARLAALEVEEAELAAALEADDRAAIEEWLAGCIRCERRDEAEAAAERLNKAETLVAPCVAAAGLPQSGGPRQLDDIDIPKARALCDAALAALPADIRLHVLAGRIAQAEGHDDEAAAAYDEGVAAGLPEAFGLAAYLHLSPPAGATPDPEAAAALARTGAEQGDWLSREVLVLLYSRGLVADHGPDEATALARDLAAEGDVVADFFLGYFLQNGIGTEVDEVGAVTHLARALDGGYARAAPYLARMLESGRGIEADPDRAAALLWQALEAGDGVAIEMLTTGLNERPHEVIRLIQEKLIEAGDLSGAADGRAGPATRGAVEAHVRAITGKDESP